MNMIKLSLETKWPRPTQERRFFAVMLTSLCRSLAKGLNGFPHNFTNQQKARLFCEKNPSQSHQKI